jgi:hypothetical protein
MPPLMRFSNPLKSITIFGSGQEIIKTSSQFCAPIMKLLKSLRRDLVSVPEIRSQREDFRVCLHEFAKTWGLMPHVGLPVREPKVF